MGCALFEISGVLFEVLVDRMLIGCLYNNFAELYDISNRAHLLM